MKCDLVLNRLYLKRIDSKSDIMTNVLFIYRSNMIKHIFPMHPIRCLCCSLVVENVWELVPAMYSDIP